MKFVPDANQKKVRIVAESRAEEAWLSTVKSSAHRVTRGAERYVRAAYAAWISANGGEAAVSEKLAQAATAPIADLASAWGAATNAAPEPQWRQGAKVAAAKAAAAARREAVVRAETRADIGEIISWAERLEFDADYRDGLSGKAESGALVGRVNTVCQRAGIRPPSLAGIPWTERARVILDWVGGL